MVSNRRGFTLAVAASAGLHLLLGGAVVVWSRSHGHAEVAPLVLGTRVEAPVTLEWRDVGVEVAAPTPPAPSPPSPPPQTEPATPSAEVEAASTGRRPEVTPVPERLPRSVLDRVRRYAPGPEAEIQQVAAAMPGPQRAIEGGEPLHGSLARGQTIIYLLDASGSMGQAGKLERAKRALAATLREQSDEVRFQVIVYAGFARVLVPGGCLTASEENVERTVQALYALEPAGRSTHEDALKLAATFNPEHVLVLTDAEELPGQAIRDLSRRLARPPVLTLAVVRGDRVEAPTVYVTK